MILSSKVSVFVLTSKTRDRGEQTRPPRLPPHIEAVPEPLPSPHFEDEIRTRSISVENLNFFGIHGRFQFLRVWTLLRGEVSFGGMRPRSRGSIGKLLVTRAFVPDVRTRSFIEQRENGFVRPQ